MGRVGSHTNSPQRFPSLWWSVSTVTGTGGVGMGWLTRIVLRIASKFTIYYKLLQTQPLKLGVTIPPLDDKKDPLVSRGCAQVPHNSGLLAFLQGFLELHLTLVHSVPPAIEATSSVLDPTPIPSGKSQCLGHPSRKPPGLDKGLLCIPPAALSEAFKSLLALAWTVNTCWHRPDFQSAFSSTVSLFPISVRASGLAESR